MEPPKKERRSYHAYPAHAPFGGYKQSGFGRETHKMMLNHYRQTKNMLVSYDKSKLGETPRTRRPRYTHLPPHPVSPPPLHPQASFRHRLLAPAPAAARHGKR